MGEARHAADITVGIAANKGSVTALESGADIPAFSRKGALADLGGQLDFFLDVLTLGSQGVDIPLKVYDMGRSVLSVMACSEGHVELRRGPNASASLAEWAFCG